MAKADKAPEKGSLDIVKWFVVVVLVVAAIVGNIYFDHYAMALRAAAVIVVAIVAALIAITTQKGAAGWAFVKESRMEMRKVVWPTRQETVQTTMLVIGLVALMGLILWGVDSLFALLLSNIFV